MSSVGLFTYSYGHDAWEVGGSNTDLGTIVGVVHPTRPPARFSPSNMSNIVFSKFI